VVPTITSMVDVYSVGRSTWGDGEIFKL